MPSNFEQLVFEIIATDRNASAAFDRFRQKVDQASRSVDESSKTIDRSQGSLDKLGKSAEKAAGAGGLSALIGTGGLQGGGMGAVIAAGVALSPVIATVGVGLGGFAAAAYAVAKPIEKAAHATGGLQANLGKLNPEQRQVALGLLGLGKQFAGFEKQMQPAVFTVFNQGLKLAGTLLHGIEPVAAATGKALGGALGQIGAEFKSGEWQAFFGFMARTAGPDIQLLTTDFVGLMRVLPPLLENLQPVATTLLKDTSGLLNLVSATEKAALAEHKFTAEAANNTGWLGKLAHAAGDAFNRLVPGASTARTLAGDLAKLGGNSNTAAKGLAGSGAAADGAVTKVLTLKNAVALLNTSMTTLVGNLLQLQGSDLAWKQSMQAALVQLRSNTAGLEGNSKNALANRQAVLASTQAALQFASQELATGRDIGGASRTVQAQIRFLQGLHDKSAFVRAELAALRKEEQLLQAEHLKQQIQVNGIGRWQIAGPGGSFRSGQPIATGGLITGGVPGRDSVPILAMPGELVVPTKMVAAGLVDHLRGALPGFAAGGIVPSYSGAVGGLKPWVMANDAATIRLIDQAVVKATLAGIHAAQAAASGAAAGSGGPASGAVRALQAYAASLFGQFGWGGNQLGPLIALWNGESGWNPLARNPSSGAFGIPQALPPGKMGALAASGNAAAQIRWGEGYIHSVYGTPANAYGTWLSRSPHWYDQGGWLPPGLSLALNTTGAPERVGGGGNTYHITVNVPPSANKADIGRQVVETIKEFEKRSGAGWRS